MPVQAVTLTQKNMLVTDSCTVVSLHLQRSVDCELLVLYWVLGYLQCKTRLFGVT
jgi:hypothetical protein